MNPAALTALQAAAVVGLVEIAKSRGLPTRYCALLSPFVGALILALYAAVPPEYVGVLNAVTTGLAGTGGYGLISAAGATVAPQVTIPVPMATSGFSQVAGTTVPESTTTTASGRPT